MFADEPIPYCQESYQLHVGDKLVVYSDGLTEWQDHNGECNGTERLAHSLHEQRAEPVDRRLSRLLSTIETFARATQPHDDATVLCLKCGQHCIDTK